MKMSKEDRDFYTRGGIILAAIAVVVVCANTTWTGAIISLVVLAFVALLVVSL